MPRPVSNLKILLEGRTFFLDKAWPERDQHYAEIDGRGFHVLAEDWEDDLDHQNVLTSHGWKPLRYSTRAIRDTPDEVGRRTLIALGPGAT